AGERIRLRRDVERLRDDEVVRRVEVADEELQPVSERQPRDDEGNGGEQDADAHRAAEAVPFGKGVGGQRGQTNIARWTRSACPPPRSAPSGASPRASRRSDSAATASTTASPRTARRSRRRSTRASTSSTPRRTTPTDTARRSWETSSRTPSRAAGSAVRTSS